MLCKFYHGDSMADCLTIAVGQRSSSDWSVRCLFTTDFHWLCDNSWRLQSSLSIFSAVWWSRTHDSSRYDDHVRGKNTANVPSGPSPGARGTWDSNHLPSPYTQSPQSAFGQVPPSAGGYGRASGPPAGMYQQPPPSYGNNYQGYQA